MNNPIDDVPTCDEDLIDADDYNHIEQATNILEDATNNLIRINNDINGRGYSFDVAQALEYTKVTTLIGIGHALTALANKHEDNENDDDTLTRHVLDETLG